MKPCDTFQDDLPAQRTIRRIERRIGPDALLKVFALLSDESSNNREIARRFGLELWDVRVIRMFPWVVVGLLTAQKEARQPAIILPFKQSA